MPRSTTTAIKQSAYTPSYQYARGGDIPVAEILATKPLYVLSSITCRVVHIAKCRPGSLFCDPVWLRRSGSNLSCKRIWVRCTCLLSLNYMKHTIIMSSKGERGLLQLIMSLHYRNNDTLHFSLLSAYTGTQCKKEQF